MTGPSPSTIRQRILAVAAGIASSTDLEAAGRALTAATLDLLGCVRSYCLFHDPSSGELWAEPPAPREIDGGVGLVGLAAREGTTMLVHLARAHRAYRPDVDDPGGRGDERILVQPIASHDGVVHAVLVAVRASDGLPFGGDDLERSSTLAADVAPMLEHLERVMEAGRRGNDEAEMFRPEAVANREQGVGHGDVIRVTPGWLPAVSWILLAFFACAVAFLSLGRVDQYSTGTGAVRAGDRAEVVCRDAGTLETVLVSPGDSVRAGQLLATLDDRDLRAELARLELEHDAQLRARMRDPADTRTAQSVLALRAQLDAARARLRRREIRAEHDGIVVDLRARVGRPIAPGDTLLTMSKPAEPLELVALLPGDDRPQIRPGMMLRFQLPGYGHDEQWFAITEVGDAVLGPADAAHLLGPEVGEVVTPTGPSVVVRARIPSSTFVARGEVLEYHHGMHGAAEVRLRREPLLFVLLPFLREVWG